MSKKSISIVIIIIFSQICIFASVTSAQWYIETVNSIGDVGEYTSIAIDSSGNVHISYYNNTHGNLKYATPLVRWHAQILDSSAFTYNNRSIALDSLDNVHIGYCDWNNGDLKYASNTSGVWQIEIVDSSVGPQWHTYGTSIAVDSYDHVHIIYNDISTFKLKYICS